MIYLGVLRLKHAFAEWKIFRWRIFMLKLRRRTTPSPNSAKVRDGS
jgi:hypothetical protein